eukprot:454080-Amphidinium_carterae.1
MDAYLSDDCSGEAHTMQMWDGTCKSLKACLWNNSGVEMLHEFTLNIFRRGNTCQGFGVLSVKVCPISKTAFWLCVRVCGFATLQKHPAPAP